MTTAASMYVMVWMRKRVRTPVRQHWIGGILLKPSEKESLVETLRRMKTLFDNARGDGGLYVWNTGTFDVDVLNNAYKRLIDQNETLINFWEIRDCRSMRTMVEMFPRLQQAAYAVTHNAHEDCIRQIGYITDVTRYLAEQD